MKQRRTTLLDGKQVGERVVAQRGDGGQRQEVGSRGDARDDEGLPPRGRRVEGAGSRVADRMSWVAVLY